MTVAVPHVRVVMPSRSIGVLAAARGARFYITLPGQSEVEARWLTGADLHLSIDDVRRVDLHTIASLQVEYEDEP